MVTIRLIALLLCCLSVTCFSFGCAGPSEEEPHGTQPTETDTEPAETPVEPDGAHLYTYITEDNNYINWNIWPGKGKLDNGTAPHGALITVYISDDAYASIEHEQGVMGDGSIIVKENYNLEEELQAITVMYKVENYDPDNNDWFWVKYLSNGTVESEGKVEGCIGCHESKSDNDYLFTGLITE